MINPRKLRSITARILVIICALLFSVNADAQNATRQAPPFKERLFFGGNFGLQVGSLTDIQVAPVVGFWVLPRVALAVGPDYRFYSFYKNSTHLYGGKGYVELTLLRNINSVIPIGANTDIIAHLEDEMLSLESAFFKDPPFTSKRFLTNTILAGGGLSQQIGKRSSLNIIVLWAVTEEEYGIYSKPEFRLSFMF